MKTKPLTDRQILKALRKKRWTGKTITDIVEIDGYEQVTALMCALRGTGLHAHEEPSNFPSLELVEAVLSKGVDVNATDDSGCNALWYMFDFPKFLPILVAHGIDLNCTNDVGETYLEDHLSTLPFIDETSTEEMMTPSNLRDKERIEVLIAHGATITPNCLARLQEESGSYWSECVLSALAMREKKALEEKIPKTHHLPTSKVRI